MPNQTNTRPARSNQTGLPVEGKFILLLETMENTNPNIDDPELRWVEHKIEQMEDGYTPTKNDLLTANLYWNKWETK